MKQRVLSVAILLIAALLLAACPSPTPAPTAVPATPTPDGWSKYETAELTIWLPVSWTVLNVGSQDLETAFAQFQKTNPELSKVIGSSQALQGMLFWGFNTQSQAPGFTDYLTIQRTAGATADLPSDVTAVTERYRQLGLTITESRADLQIGGRPAARIVYTYPITVIEGQQATVNGTQYIVATAADLWVVTFTTGTEQQAALAPVFEQSAQSLRIK